MAEELFLQRFTDDPWGFRLTGGVDFGIPLNVIKVTGGSVAEEAGVEVGDLVLEINGQSTQNLTHIEAQNIILSCKNRMTLNVLRGTEVTPPCSSPSREFTPIDGATPFELNEIIPDITPDFVVDEMIQINEKFHDDDYDAELTNFDQQNLRSEHNLPQLSENVTDLELDEVLTGNEEVLDHGVIGINFQKFLPQADFIRQSEVFKFLQNENIKKEIPEQVQLLKEPTKRFSTFLMKPKGPSSLKSQGPFWHYPKAPNYLPRRKSSDKDQPHRRIVKPTPESGHSVLWLFLGESGDHVVDERWGTDEEERINISRCEERSEDIIPDSGRESREDILTNSGRTSREDVKRISDSTTGEVTKVESGRTSKEDFRSNISKENFNIAEDEQINFSNNTYIDENYNEDLPKYERFEKQIERNVDFTDFEFSDQKLEENLMADPFAKQLAEIKLQLAILEENAQGDLQTQLLEVQEQLSKILEMKATQIYNEFNEIKDELDDASHVSNDECSDKKDDEEHRSGPVSECDEELPFDENIEEIDKKEYEEIEEIEGLKKGEFEICEAPPIAKSSVKVLTPQPRPIVLPGGRMWRQPKDAAQDEFYQGVLVEQAEVLVGGTNVGVNFKKYVPPKFDSANSSVYKLVQELENKLEKTPEDDYYYKPITKRELYLASLPQPAPIGEVELAEMPNNK